MLDFLKKEITGKGSCEDKVSSLRELLQLLCLKVLYDKGYFARIAFTGGTALRILYDSKRFSEDLDFSVIEKRGYDFKHIASDLANGFRLNGLEMALKTRTVKTVNNGMMKFPGLLKALGLSPMASQNLSIKLEIDSNPPAGGDVEKTLVNKAFMLNLTHFSLPSLYATKLHACFFRKYIKGRDFYDFLWYLGKKIKPNYILLNNAIHQTQGEFETLDENNIKDFLLRRVEKVDFGAVKKDVERFLEDKSELRLLNTDVVEKGIRDAF